MVKQIRSTAMRRWLFLYLVSCSHICCRRDNAVFVPAHMINATSTSIDFPGGWEIVALIALETSYCYDVRKLSYPSMLIEIPVFDVARVVL